MPTRTSKHPSYTPTLQTPSEHESQLLSFFALHRIARPSDLLHSFPFFTSHNVVIRHLNKLANQGFLRRHDYIDGYIYNITADGYVRCRDFEDIPLDRLPYRYDEPSGTQAQHELLITKVAVGIYQHAQRSNTVKIIDEGRFCLGNIEHEQVVGYESRSEYELSRLIDLGLGDVS